MKVLISGGDRTRRIVDAIEKKFNGTADFVVVPYIEGIENAILRGESYDKAIITEHSITHEMVDNNVDSLRSKLNTFCTTTCSKDVHQQHIFLTQYQELADIIYEESLPIRKNSVVVLKQPKYSVSFFAELITTDINNLSNDLVYEPEDEEPETIEDDSEDDELVLHKGKIFAGDIHGKDAGEAGVEYDSNLEDAEDSSTGFDTYDDEEGLDKTDSLDTLEKSAPGQLMSSINEAEPEMGMVGGFEDEDNFGFVEAEEEPEFTRDYIAENEPEFMGDINSDVDNISFKDYDDDIKDETLEDESAFIYGGEDSEDEADNDDGFSGYDGDEDSFSEEEDEVDPEQNEEEFRDYDEPVKKKKGFLGGKGKKEPKQPKAPKKQLKPQKTKNADSIYVAGFDMDNVKRSLQAFANKGSSIVVTGCGGSGTSTVAYHLANVIKNLNYTVLLVDFDVKGRTQSYISKDNYDSMGPDDANLMAAINSGAGINATVSIISQGFHLLSMGIGGDIVPIEKIITREKVTRFLNLAKTSHNFVIYDLPFEFGQDYLSDVVYMADSLVMVTDASTWGVTKTMLAMCNVETDEMQDNLFTRTQILLNRCRGVDRVFGKKVKKLGDFTEIMDFMMQELIGEDPGFYFSRLKVIGAIDQNDALERGWFAKEQFSDTRAGMEIFAQLLCNIVLN